MSVERKDLDRLEESMYDCWNITDDIKKILDVSEFFEDDIQAVLDICRSGFPVTGIFEYSLKLSNSL